MVGTIPPNWLFQREKRKSVSSSAPPPAPQPCSPPTAQAPKSQENQSWKPPLSRAAIRLMTELAKTPYGQRSRSKSPSPASNGRVPSPVVRSPKELKASPSPKRRNSAVPPTATSPSPLEIPQTVVNPKSTLGNPSTCRCFDSSKCGLDGHLSKIGSFFYEDLDISKLKSGKYTPHRNSPSREASHSSDKYEPDVVPPPLDSIAPANPASPSDTIDSDTRL